MSYSTNPSLDAERHYAPRFAEQDAANEQAADDDMVASEIEQCMRKFQSRFSKAVAARVILCTSEMIGKAYWCSGDDMGEVAEFVLSDLHDDLMPKPPPTPIPHKCDNDTCSASRCRNCPFYVGAV